MGKLTAAVSIGQTSWDTLLDTSTKGLADLDSTANTKLSGIEDSATADQSAAEVQTAIKAMAWADREIVITEPAVGEHQVKGIHRSAAGDLEYDYEETAES